MNNSRKLQDESFAKAKKDYDQGDFPRALEAYNKALEINPQFAEALCGRGNTKRALGAYEEALDDYNESIRLKPNYAEAYWGRGHARFSLGDPKGAVSDHEEAIRLKTN
jgi:tetratricopeptide (TPR) repeat protein